MRLAFSKMNSTILEMVFGAGPRERPLKGSVVTKTGRAGTKRTSSCRSPPASPEFWRAWQRVRSTETV